MNWIFKIKQNTFSLLAFLSIVFLSQPVTSQKDNIISLDYIRNVRAKYKAHEKNAEFKSCIDTLRSILITENHKFKKAFIYREMGSKYYEWSKLDSSEIYFNKALNHFTGTKEYNNEVYKIKFSLGNICTSRKQLEKAMNIYLDVLSYFEKQKDTSLLVTIYSNIGVVLSKNGNQKDAEKYFFNALHYSLKKNDYKSIASIYNHLAELNLNSYANQIDKSIEYGLMALDAAKKSNNVRYINTITANLGTYFTHKGDFNRAKPYLLQAENDYSKAGNYSVHLYKNLARIFTYEMDSDSALLFFNKIDFTKLTSYEVQHFNNLRKALENGTQSMTMFIELDKYKIKYDSMMGAKVNTQASELEKKYNIALKDNEIRKLNEQYLNGKLQTELLKNENIERRYDLEKTQNESNLRKLNLELVSQSEKKALLKNEKLSLIYKNTSIKLESQKKITTIFSALIGLLVFFVLWIWYQWRKNKNFNRKLEMQKKQIQLLNSELNHRVKNNLSFMTSLLEMQGRRSDNIEIKEALKESENRLKALALVHNQLFKSESDTEVNLKKYLQEVTIYLKEIFATKEKPIEFETNFADFQINAEDAMRLGLIVNELVTNSVKHAFIEVENPLIKISTSIITAGKLSLHYADNGPKTIADLENNLPTDSLGLKLISLLKKQLGDRYILMM